MEGSSECDIKVFTFSFVNYPHFFGLFSVTSFSSPQDFISPPFFLRRVAFLEGNLRPSARPVFFFPTSRLFQSLLFSKT